MIKAVLFDLFYTLIKPTYNAGQENEYDVIGISSTEWEKYAEDDILYTQRAKGKVKSGIEIINQIADIMPYSLTNEQKRMLLIRRENRMKSALLKVDPQIIITIATLHSKGIKIGLISNADVIDCKYWAESPLAIYFNYVIFSYNVGLLKPDVEIYKLAMNALNIKPQECLFVGDGGSNELEGAKNAGMKTCFTEYLEVKLKELKSRILKYSDFVTSHFPDILEYIDDLNF